MYSFTKPGLDVGADLDTEPEQVLEFKVEACQVQEAPSVVHIDEKIDVAVWSRVTPGD
jgi:hypothetical protein